MAAALGAIKGFFHHISDDWTYRNETQRRVVTILDVLGPRVAEA